MERFIAWSTSPSAGAFRQRQQVVIPFAVRVGAQIFAVWAIDHANVAAIARNLGVKGIGLGLDGVDHLLTSPAPAGAAEVSYPFVGVITRLLVDAGNLNVSHGRGFFLGLRIGAVAAIGFFGDALKRRSAILDAHKLTSALVALLIVAIIALELGAGGDCAATKVASGILGHKCSCDLS